MNKPFVSVVVCTHNAEHNVGNILDSLITQKYSNKEIIVVDDKSTDKTRDVIDRYGKNVKKIYNKKNLRFSKSFNNGVRKSKGDIIISLHDDCIPNGEQWIDEMIEPFLNDERVGVVLSQRIIKGQMNIAEKLFNSVAPSALKIDDIKPVITNFTRFKADAYRKKVFDEIGLLSETGAFFNAGQDNVFSIDLRKKGYNIVISNKAKVTYTFSSEQNSIGSIFKKAFIMTTSGPALYKRYKYDGLLARLSMYSFFGFIISLPLYLFVTFWILPLLILSTAFYLYYGFATAIRNRDLGILIPAVFIFAIIWKIMLGLGYFKAILGGTRE